ncbi:MAG: cupin domain-containing protein [Bacteroidaceae bacterium]|nr:cupin domain-containing protein [Bacteroidaceae bacterium]
MSQNYACKSLNGWANVHGKIFLGEELGMTGAQASLQRLAPGEDAPFLHSHKTHEELYIIISGNGEYQVDGEIFPVAEGSIIRVAPEGVRALRNTGNIDMVMCCVQYQAGKFGASDDFMIDANISAEPVKW